MKEGKKRTQLELDDAYNDGLIQAILCSYLTLPEPLLPRILTT